MPVTRRKRADVRRDATRAALIEAAESLIAESGVEAVSTRRIGAAAGSSNTNVVSYHFGGKESLIREVYRHRLPNIDSRRGELLAQADAAQQGDDLAVLIRAFFLPLFEQTDAHGRHSYARFIAAMERAGMISTRGELIDEFPETNRLDQRILERIPRAARHLVNHRRRLAANLIAAALLQIDQEASDNSALAEELFENAIAMATAAMAADAPSARRRQTDKKKRS